MKHDQREIRGRPPSADLGSAEGGCYVQLHPNVPLECHVHVTASGSFINPSKQTRTDRHCQFLLFYLEIFRFCHIFFKQTFFVIKFCPPFYAEHLVLVILA